MPKGWSGSYGCAVFGNIFEKDAGYVHNKIYKNLGNPRMKYFVLRLNGEAVNNLVSQGGKQHAFKK